MGGISFPLFLFIHLCLLFFVCSWKYFLKKIKIKMCQFVVCKKYLKFIKDCILQGNINLPLVGLLHCQLNLKPTPFWINSYLLWPWTLDQRSRAIPKALRKRVRKNLSISSPFTLCANLYPPRQIFFTYSWSEISDDSLDRKTWMLCTIVRVYSWNEDKTVRGWIMELQFLD